MFELHPGSVSECFVHLCQVTENCQYIEIVQIQYLWLCWLHFRPFPVNINSMLLICESCELTSGTGTVVARNAELMTLWRVAQCAAGIMLLNQSSWIVLFQEIAKMGSRVLKIAGFTFLLLLCHLASLPGVDTLDCDPAWPRTESTCLKSWIILLI